MSNDLILSLRSKGKTVGCIARTLNVHRQCVYDSLKGKGVRRIRVHIAQIVGVPPSSLFSNLSYQAKAVDDADFYRLKSSENTGVSA
jgi:hypothetical protein